MSTIPTSTLVGSSMIALALWCSPGALAQDAAVDGTFALSGVTAGVAGNMQVRETAPLTRELEFEYRDGRSDEPVADFDVELTQELHVLAVDAGLTTLIHRHVEQADESGRFATELQFPQEGSYHVYTDAVPTGYGQQVHRFDLEVGNAADAAIKAVTQFADISAGPIFVSEGDYTVALDASALRADAESMLTLSIEKDGAPAEDLRPYLGVAAHAVLIRAEDLAYIHAHAMGDGDMHGQHDADAMHGHAGANDHGGHGAPGDDVMATGAEISVHLTLPGPGDYALWIEFMGGDEVVTVPFALAVPPR